MKKALIGLVIIIILVGAYFVVMPKGVQAPTPSNSVQISPTSAATVQTATPQKRPADVGAGGVYDPNTPQGSPEQCAACGQYSGSQKAQCLAALNCQ